MCRYPPPTATPGIWGIKFKASFDFLLSQCPTILSIKMANWWKRFKINTAGTYFIKCLVPSHWISPLLAAGATWHLCVDLAISLPEAFGEKGSRTATPHGRGQLQDTYCSSFSELVSGAPAGFSQFLKPRMKNGFLKISFVIWKQAMELFKDFSSIFWYQYVLPRYPGLLAVFQVLNYSLINVVEQSGILWTREMAKQLRNKVRGQQIMAWRENLPCSMLL